ncbi:Protein of unknown function [Micromonospora lupini str. Lupac 08]|uniref:Uncharacterized protein n=1 Tax=Micromonospora lupini str. Lupac 08 TaxID=1150864 RepID=I0KVI4_9ACTN|nr:Protein of unknown function [Micromonospora lupini str. Lupac 08]
MSRCCCDVRYVVGGSPTPDRPETGHPLWPPVPAAVGIPVLGVGGSSHPTKEKPRHDARTTCA